VTDPRLGPKVVETHTAILFFVGDHVYKVKKALDFGFLDNRQREARERACHQEVELNRRLAPSAYFGVLDLIDEQGIPIDHVVDMRRMPDDRRLAACIARDEDVRDAVRTTARSLAALHGRSTPEPRHDQRATRDAVRGRWADGFDQLRGLPLEPHDAERLGMMERLAMRYLAGRAPLFDDRIARGWIRDGHGDLQAEDVFLLDDGPQILDCIEFGDEYRWGDVLSDVAFLSMDLERLGRPDLARVFLDLHREFCADAWPASLAHHYTAYRAHIRAKVEILRATQLSLAVAPAASPYLDLASAHLEAAQVRLVLVGGAPGTGKSTVAGRLGDRLGAVVLRTDEVRQRVPSAGDERYAPEAVHATYVETVREARRLVGLGHHVVVDATWATDEHRALARRLAIDASTLLVEVCCTLPRAVADERIRRRRTEGTDLSEATVEVAHRLAGRFERWPEALELPTDAPPDDVADRAHELVIAAARWDLQP
jgi:aminoglycoside phosphotransferase family enzyme/predicted kinase